MRLRIECRHCSLLSAKLICRHALYLMYFACYLEAQIFIAFPLVTSIIRYLHSVQGDLTFLFVIKPTTLIEANFLSSFFFLSKFQRRPKRSKLTWYHMQFQVLKYCSTSFYLHRTIFSAYFSKFEVPLAEVRKYLIALTVTAAKCHKLQKHLDPIRRMFY